MDSGFSNMLENTRKYFQGIPTDAASTAAAAAAAAAAQLHFPPPLPPSHHLHHNGGGRSSMNSSSSSSELSSASATDRFAGYHHPHLRYNYQPYSSPGHYPRTAVDPKPAAFQPHHFQPPSSSSSSLQYHHHQQHQQQHHHQLPPSTSSSSSSSSPPSPYKSPYQLQPLPPPLTVKHQQQHPSPPSQFKPMTVARSSPPANGKQYSPPKPPQSPYAVVSKPTSGAPPPQSPFTAPKEQQLSVPETPPPSPHSSHFYNRTTQHSNLQQQAIDRDYLRFKPIQTPPPPQNRFQPLERPKSEVPVAGGTGPQSSHLAIRYDPKLEQPRSGVRAVPIAQAKQPSSSSTTTAQHDVNRVVVQKPEPLRYHQQQQQQQQHQHQHNNNGSNHHPHRSSDDHHIHHKRPASVQPSYLDSRPFQIKPYDGGGNNNSNGSSSNGSSGSGQSSSASSYHRPFAVAPLPPSSQASAAIIVSGMDHRWAGFDRQDGRAPPAFLQQSPSVTSAAAAAVINGYHHHRQQPPPSSSSSLPAIVVSQHHQQQSLSRQQQSQHFPLNLHKLTQPARPATAAGQLQQPVKLSQENNNTNPVGVKLRFEPTKRESPLDLSVKTVCRSADSTDDRLNPFGHDIPKVNFKPDFNTCRGPSTSLPGATSQPPQTVAGGQQQHLQHNNAGAAYHHQFDPQLSLTLPPPTPLPPTVAMQPPPQQQLQPLSSAAALTTPLPPVVRHHHHHHNNHNPGPPLSSADEAWRAAIDRQIEQKFNSYTSSKKHHGVHHPHAMHHQYPQLPQHLQPLPLTAMQPQPEMPSAPPPPQPSQQGPAQADKRVLEILKHNIEARDQSSKPQIAEAPSTPAMVFSTPIRKEPSTTPLKKTDYYMAERTAVTPFPKKIDYYMDRPYCNAPRIRTKAERKQISAEGSSSGTRMSSPMAAATAISPHPFLPSSNSAPQTKQEMTPLTQTEVVVDLKLDIKREPSPIKDPDLSLLNKEEPEKDEDDEDFWTNTCNSFVVQLAETQEKKKVKTPVKRKSPKELLPQQPKRKYTKRIKIESVTETDKDNKSSDVQASKSVVEVKLEKSPLLENVVSEEKTLKNAEALDMDKENKTKPEDPEETVDDIKEKENNEDKLTTKGKPKGKRLLKLKLVKPLIAKVKKIKKEHKKELKMKELKKETKKEEKKEMKKGEKKELLLKSEKKELQLKSEKKEVLLKSEKKELIPKSEKKELLPKSEKKELAAVSKEEKKGLKKEEKRELKKEQQPDHSNKKDLNNKKESKKAESTKKKVVVEKENLTKNMENTSRRSAAAAVIEVAGKFNPRQSLRRKNSLKDYTFAFDELLDDAFAHFETDKIPVTKRRRKGASPSPSPAPTVVATAAVGATQLIAVVKKSKEKDNETIRMRLRSRNRPLLAKQEPQKASKKKANAKNKIIPKRRRKKSLGEKSAHAANTVATTDDWKDELYKFKRSLRLPSKLISVVSPPTAGAVAPDQVSLTSIMNIPPPKQVKESKAAKLAAACQSSQAAGPGGKNKPKRLGGLLFGRREVLFKGRRLMKREKIVSAEKLMQRNRRKRRQREDEVKKGCAGEEATASHLDDYEEEVHAEEEEEEEEEDDEDDGGSSAVSSVKPPARILFKRKFMRKKFRSGFDYIKKKKKKEPASEKKPATVVTTAAAIPVPPSAPRFVSEIHAEIKGWIVNKGHGETVLHRAARLGVNDVVGYCMEKLEYAPSVADNAGYTPLHEACSHGHYHIAKLLLLFGADVSASAKGGIRPLHEAVENGDVHLVRLLLSYGADPHLATYSGQSPLSLATDRQTRMLLEHHVNDVQGYGSASVWNFDESTLTREPEDIDRLLWCVPPAPSPAPVDDGPSFEFEFAEQSLPDVYVLPSDGAAGDNNLDDDWVLFADVSTALSVSTADALAKLLDVENAVTAVPADRFNERAVLRKTLGRQPVAAAAQKAGAEHSPKDDDPAATTAESATTTTTAATATSVVDAAPAAATTTTNTTTAIATSSSTSGGEQNILLVRYDRKLKQLLGVDVYSVS